MVDYKIEIIEHGVIGGDDENNIFGFCAWPTVGKLNDGTLLAVCSGMRTRHIDPFGKILGYYSFDNGKTWTNPTILIDTMLDDRDGGVCVTPFGKVIVFGVNNKTAFQRSVADYKDRIPEETALYNAYLDLAEKYNADKQHGAYYILSDDGFIFDKELHYIPIYAPHGAVALEDNSLLLAGCEINKETNGNNLVSLYKSVNYLEWEKIGEITFDSSFDNYDVCEAHCVKADNGNIIVQMRVQNNNDGDFVDNIFIYQSISKDGGKSFSTAKRICVGGPPHLLKLKSGLLLMSYGYRKKPYGQKIMISEDNGETWQGSFDIRTQEKSFDTGYPSTVELDNGELITVYYQTDKRFGLNGIKYTKWKLKRG